MLHKVDDEFEIQIPCGCHTEKIIIHKFDDLEDYYYLEFWVTSFYSTQSLWRVLKDRIKMAWRALLKGNYIHQEITLDEQKIIELRDNLTELLQKCEKEGVKGEEFSSCCWKDM